MIRTQACAFGVTIAVASIAIGAGRCAPARGAFLVTPGVNSARPPAVAQAPTAAQLALFERYLDALRDRARIPGLSAAVVFQRRIIWEAGLGYQDLERR